MGGHVCPYILQLCVFFFALFSYIIFDGSKKGESMNLKLLCSVAIFSASFGLVACDDSSSANSSGGQQNVGGTFCNVSTTSNSVTVNMSWNDSRTYMSTVLDDGSYYKKIADEYWYADRNQASEECENQKKEASHWKDGSMAVSCSGNRVYVNFIDEGSLREYEDDYRDMCEDFLRRTNTGKTTNNSSDGSFKCDVSRSSNSVKIAQSYMGEAFEETTTWSQGTNGRNVAVGVRKITFTDPEDAAEECADEKDEARYSDDELYDVECTSNTVIISKTVKNYDIDSYEEYYKDWCEDQRRRLNSGDIDRYM